MSKKIQPLIFLGASVFPEVAEIARDINSAQMTYELSGILDDDASWHGKTVEGVPVLGPLDQAKQYKDALIVMGIGAYRSRLLRYDIIKRLGLPAEKYATLIHPAVKIYRSAKIGHGVLISSGVVVFNGCVVENFVKILPNSVIGTYNTICEGAMITSLVTTTTQVRIGHYSHIGTGTCIGDAIKIGPGAQIGMGSLVLRDVNPGVFAFGNPLRSIDKIDVPQDLLDKWNQQTLQSQPK